MSTMPLRALTTTLVLLLAVAAARAAPAPVLEVLHVREVRLASGYDSKWQAERPRVERGVLLVLRVDPELVRPRETAQPVLYWGDRVVERFNSGFGSGRVVAFVRGEVDLAAQPLWFGTPAAPEQVDAAWIADERRLAEEAGIDPPAAEAVAAAEGAGRPPLRLDDRSALQREAAALIRKHAPDEQTRADVLEGRMSEER